MEMDQLDEMKPQVAIVAGSINSAIDGHSTMTTHQTMYEEYSIGTLLETVRSPDPMGRNVVIYDRGTFRKTASAKTNWIRWTRIAVVVDPFMRVKDGSFYPDGQCPGTAGGDVGDMQMSNRQPDYVFKNLDTAIPFLQSLGKVESIYIHGKIDLYMSAIKCPLVHRIYLVQGINPGSFPVLDSTEWSMVKLNSIDPLNHTSNPVNSDDFHVLERVSRLKLLYPGWWSRKMLDMEGKQFRLICYQLNPHHDEFKLVEEQLEQLQIENGESSGQGQSSDVPKVRGKKKKKSQPKNGSCK